MARATNLLPASLDGVSFEVRSERLTTGGRRVVLHEYPNSSKRNVEDLGELPPRFSVMAFVHGPDFLARADRLERVLREPGAKVLYMSTFGIKKLFTLPYRKDASQTSVGEIRFELEFAEGQAVSAPIKAPVTIETVYSLGDSSRDAINDGLAAVWDVPTSTPNVITAQFDLEQFANTASNAVATAVNNIVDLQKQTESILKNSQTFVRDPQKLAEEFVITGGRGLWQTISVGLIDGKGLDTVMALTRFGAQLSLSLSDIKRATLDEDFILTEQQSETQIPTWPETTGERVQRNKNRINLINAGRVSALVNAYEQAAANSYQTGSEVEAVRELLEAEHERLMKVDIESPGILQSDQAIRSAVEAVRNASLSVLDDKEQSAYTLTVVRAETPVSAFVLSYQLYAERQKTSEDVTENAIMIRELNPDQISDKMVGDIIVPQIQ
jgi:prophage DNA circulation protein